MLHCGAHLNYGSKMINPGGKQDLTNREENAKVENDKATENWFEEKNNRCQWLAYQIMVYGTNAGLSHMK